MGYELLKKYGPPIGIVLFLLVTLLLVKCDINHTQRDAMGRPDIPGVPPTP